MNLTQTLRIPKLKEWLRSDDRLEGYTYVGPGVLIVLLVTIGPLLWALFFTFHQWQPAVNPEAQFIALENYAWVFTSDRWWAAVQNFAYYGLVGTTLEVALGTVLALSLHNYVENDKLRVALLVLFVLPMMFAPVIVAGIWRLMFNPGGGVINGLLALVGIPSVSWLDSRWMGMTALMIADIWQWTGLPFLIVYSGRAALDDSLYKAAVLDGASGWMIFRRITLPQLKNLIVVAFLLKFIISYKLFDKVFVMTNGGPGTATELPTYFTYLKGLRQFQVGRAATMSYVLVAGAAVFMYLFWKYASEEVEVGQ